MTEPQTAERLDNAEKDIARTLARTLPMAGDALGVRDWTLAAVALGRPDGLAQAASILQACANGLANNQIGATEGRALAEAFRALSDAAAVIEF